MSPSTISIIEDYEGNGATVEQIAESMEVAVEAVKAVLLSFSKKYREEVEKEGASGQKESGSGEAKVSDITDVEYKSMLEAYKNLAFGAENESIRARILKNLIDEKKGRNDVKSAVKNAGKGLNITQINVFAFNRGLKQAREAKMKEVSQTIELLTEKAS